MTTRRNLRALALIAMVIMLASMWMIGCSGGGDGGGGGSNPAPTQTTSPNPTFGTVTGKVVDQANFPVANARVYIEANGETVSDIQGNFTLPNIPTGRQILKVDYNNETFSQNIIVVEAGVYTTVSITTPQPTIVSGTVYNNSGNPVAYAKVVYSNNKGTATADNQGYFSFQAYVGDTLRLEAYYENGGFIGYTDISVTDDTPPVEITPTPSPTPSPTPTTSPSPSPTGSPIPSPTPTTSPTPSPSPTTSPNPSPTPTTSPSPSPSPTPSTIVNITTYNERGTIEPGVKVQFYQYGFEYGNPQITDNNGFTQFTTIPPGGYAIKISKERFTPEVIGADIYNGVNDLNLTIYDIRRNK